MIVYVALGWFLGGVLAASFLMAVALLLIFRALFFRAHERIATWYVRRGEWERAMHVRAASALCAGAWRTDLVWPGAEDKAADDEDEPPADGAAYGT